MTAARRAAIESLVTCQPQGKLSRLPASSRRNCSTSSTCSPPGPVSLAESLVSPDGLRPWIVNWDEVALHFLRGVQADAVADGTRETADLLKRLQSFPGLPALSEAPIEESKAPVLAIHFRKGETSLRLFTTLATLGTPHDVTLQEIRIESFFPADDDTARVFRRWANEATA